MTSSINVIHQHNGGHAAAAAFYDPDEVTVEFDDICYVDIRCQDDRGNSVDISIHRDAIPDIIARLITESGAAMDHRNRPKEEPA